MGFEDVKDKGLLGSRGEELLRQRDRRGQQKSVETTKHINELMGHMKAFSEATSSMEAMVEGELNETVKRIAKTREAVERSKAAHLANVQKRFMGATEQAFGSRSVTEDITAVSRSAASLGPSLQTAQTVNTHQLEQQMAHKRSLLRMQEARAIDTASRIDEPGMAARYKTQMGVASTLKQDIGGIDAAMRTQRKLGLDSTSIYHNAANLSGKVQSEQDQMGIASRVATGAAGNRSQVQEQLNTVSKQLITTFQKFDEAVKSGSKEADKLGKEFQTLQGQYNINKQTLSEMDRQGGGYDRFRGLAAAAGMIGDVGVVGQAAAQGYRYNMVTSEIAQTQQRQGLAAFANTRYFDQYNAGKGDMGSLRRVMSDAWGDQLRRGNEFRGRENGAAFYETTGKGVQLAGNIASGVLDAGPGVLKAAGAGASRGGQAGAVMAGLGSALGAVPGVAAGASADALQFNMLNTNYNKGITQSQAFLQSANQQRQFQDELSKIDDFSAQKTADYFTNVGMATRGLGIGAISDDRFETVTSGGSGLMGGSRTRTSRALGDHFDHTTGAPPAISAARIKKALEQKTGLIQHGSVSDSPYPTLSDNMKQKFLGTDSVAASYASSETATQFTTSKGGGDRESLLKLLTDEKNVQALAMAGLGMEDIPRLTASGVGALGKEMKGQAGLNTLMKAGIHSQAGYFQSPDQYMQAREALTGSGGRSEDLERIMRISVAAGMDSSKNIMQMVQATQAISGTSAAAGLNVTSSASDMLGLGVQSLRAKGVSENMATLTAKNSADDISNSATSKQADIFNVMEFAKLRRQFPKADMQQLNSLATADPVQIKALRKLYRDGEKKKGDQMSADLGLYGVINNADDASGLLQTTDEQTLGAKLGIGINDKIKQSIMRKRLTNEDLTLEEQSFGQGMGKLEKKTNDFTSFHSISNPNAEAVEKDLLGVRPGGGFTGSAEDKKSASAISDAKVYEDGMKSMNTAIGGLVNLGAVLQKVASGIDGEKFANQTSAAAKNITEPMTNFAASMGTTAEKLDTLVGKIDKILRSSGNLGDNN